MSKRAESSADGEPNRPVPSAQCFNRSVPSAQCFNLDGTYLSAADYERIIRRLLETRLDAAVVAIKGKTVCDEVTELRILARTGDATGEAVLDSVAAFFAA